MTPRQLFALRRRKTANMQWTELMFSRLTAAVVNAGFARPEEPVEYDAFMLHPLAPEPREPRPPTPEELEPPGEVLMRMMQSLPKGVAIRTD